MASWHNACRFWPLVSRNIKKLAMSEKLFHKRIAILGFGIEGKDVCDFMLENGAKSITVFDQKSEIDLGDDYKILKSRGVNFVFGDHYLDGGLLNYDIIFRSPAFKLSTPAIAEAREKGIEISSAIKLFFHLCPAQIIAVTGTKGKGTTSTLIYEILKRHGDDAHLAGNIGQPCLGILKKIGKESKVVLELSSFQLQDLDTGPNIAVVLFISSEHLDYHRDTNEYIEAKSQIVRHQKENDFAVLNYDNENSRSFYKLTKAKVYYFSRFEKIDGGAYVANDKIYCLGKEIGNKHNLMLRGDHNLDNICAAALASSLAGAKIEDIKKIVFSFRGLEHRLELVVSRNDIVFYNDSFSTNPDTTIAAIRSFKEPITLILGGSDKGSDYDSMALEIAKSSVKRIVLIGAMADKIKTSLEKACFNGQIIYKPGEMEDIVGAAYRASSPGDVVLLSPACASFDMFKDYKERGNQFKKYARSLQVAL